jgi:hypothetical protein
VIDDEDTGSKAYSFLMIFSAANWASASDAKSSGVTTLSTASPPTLPIRALGKMAARPVPVFSLVGDYRIFGDVGHHGIASENSSPQLSRRL